MNISIFGTGYVGLVTGSCLANLGHKVLCVDIDAKKIAALSQGEIPFYEPGLPELVQANVNKGRLRFTTDIQQGVQFAQAIFNCVGTPGKEDGSADLQYVFSVAKSVNEHATSPTLLINKSTVPPGTAKKCSQLLTSPHVHVVSNPEFLAEGKAIYDFTHPNKIVVGAQNEEAFGILRKIYTGRIRTYIPFLETDWETAEMIKYANNAFLATKISFINELANICDYTGADITMIAQAMGMDHRISPKFLQAGTGYGGSCFPKDVRALYHAGKTFGYHASLLHHVDQVNEQQKKVLVNKVTGHFNNNVQGKTLSIWGLAFKPKTSDVREAPAFVVIDALVAMGAKIQAYDPIAQEEAQKVLGNKIAFSPTVEDSVTGSSGILILTEWDEFRNVNLQALGQNMQEKVMFDGRNIYGPSAVREEGFTYYGIGRR